ncbi:MAG: hypothetical protein JW934_02295 [Anaerolineae bacterium]|nr:hypothetical protein [Anaerolineae bacterium]
MEVEFSHRTVWTAAGIALVAVLIALGRAVTPIAGDGRPLVLSPAYVATVRYLKAAQGWLDRLAQIDADLAKVMDEQVNIYTQGRDAERIFEKALSVAREVEQGKAPLSLAALQTTLSQAATGYVRASRAALLWVSAPSAENRQGVDEALSAARGKLENCQTQQEALWPAK